MENLAPQEVQQPIVFNKSLLISLLLTGFLVFGIGGYLIGSGVEKRNFDKTNSLNVLSIPVPTASSEVNAQKQNPNLKYTVKKETGNTKDSNSYKYSLISIGGSEKDKVIYSITNWFGFEYQVSDDNNFIAILNNGESLGDETLTLIRKDGRVLKEFGHLDSPQALVPFYWIENYYFISMGIPIGDPVGVIRINANTLGVDKYLIYPTEKK